jgi:hypothetical protein
MFFVQSRTILQPIMLELSESGLNYCAQIEQDEIWVLIQ